MLIFVKSCLFKMARFNSEESYFKWIRDQLKASRDFLANSLKEVGFQPHLPQGGYFIMAGYSDLPIKVDTSPEAGAKDFQIVRYVKNVFEKALYTLGLQYIVSTSSCNRSSYNDCICHCKLFRSIFDFCCFKEPKLSFFPQTSK